MHGMFRSFFVLLALAGGSLTAQAQTQTKPAVTSLGPDYPKSAIFIGNSFFYYNNSMHSHVLAMQRVADPVSQGAYFPHRSFSERAKRPERSRSRSTGPAALD